MENDEHILSVLSEESDLTAYEIARRVSERVGKAVGTCKTFDRLVELERDWLVSHSEEIPKYNVAPVWYWSLANVKGGRR